MELGCFISGAIIGNMGEQTTTRVSWGCIHISFHRFELPIF